MTVEGVSSDFRLALQAISSPALVYDEARILYANTAMQRLLGHALQDLQRMAPHDWAAEGADAELRRYTQR
ncbi:MAG TPA: PAS domain-containing protein, partial [Roseateles sp.]|nr:PAS domain-containing protein [Roseateles sp.]